MALIALLTDTHFGGKSDAIYFQEHIKKFYDDIFFPYIKENNIKKIIHLGDCFDRRKYINFVSLKNFFDCFWNPLQDLEDVGMSLIIGNHDSAFKNNNDINSPDLLLNLSSEDSIKHSVYKGPKSLIVDGCGIDFIPWINSENEEETLKLIKNSKSKILLGHLEVEGFSMYRGLKSQGGLKKELLKNYELVCSGHYHHKSSKDNICYLGSPYQITWHDHADERGFHVLNTKTNELEFIKNPYTLFEIIYYDEDKMKSFDFSLFKDKIVKIIIVKKDNLKQFDDFFERLQSVGTIEIKIEENYNFLDSEVDGEIEVENTFEILKSYINNIDCKKKDREILKDKITKIYLEALHTE